MTGSAPASAGPPPARPRPLADELTAGFWDSVRRGRLSIQWCPSCARYHHPPALICPGCNSEDLVYRTVSGRGRIYSFTTVYDPPAPGFRDLVPLLIGVVELVEQPRLLMVSNLVEVDAGAVDIGLEVEVTFAAVSPDCTLPQFRPVAG
jgi:uncharacterized OB-fold protein